MGSGDVVEIFFVVFNNFIVVVGNCVVVLYEVVVDGCVVVDIGQVVVATVDVNDTSSLPVFSASDVFLFSVVFVLFSLLLMSTKSNPFILLLRASSIVHHLKTYLGTTEGSPGLEDTGSKCQGNNSVIFQVNVKLHA